MTDDLVKWLRELGEHPCRSELPMGVGLRQAAIVLEALEAENERLRKVLSRWQYSGCPNCSGDCGSANPPVMCCIMEETRAALGEK